MGKLLDTLDGTGRLPRVVQTQALTWTEDNIRKHKVLAIDAPVGAGKSLIVETLRRAYGARCVVVTNELLDQYLRDYSTAPSLKGQDHYTCKDSTAGRSCGEMKGLGEKPCQGCPYRAARRYALENTHVYFNPMSLHYLQRDKDYAGPPQVMVIDEAHKFIKMIISLANCSFKASKYGAWPKNPDELHVENWLAAVIRRWGKKLGGLTPKDTEFMTVTRELDRLLLLQKLYLADPANYTVYEEAGSNGISDTYLVFACMTPPPDLIKSMVDGAKVVLLSATMSDHVLDVYKCLGSTLKLTLPSPIPAKQRPLYYSPISDQVNRFTTPLEVANWIRDKLNKHPKLNTIVHLTYGMAVKVAPLLADFPLVTHTPETRSAKIKVFKEQGGVFLASACEEGIDLPGDLCRLNLIPIMQKPYLGDPAVKKRQALSDGQAWYEQECLQMLIQQTGRSTRNETDHSIAYVGDSSFPRYFMKQKQRLPQSFKDAVKWSNK